MLLLLLFFAERTLIGPSLMESDRRELSLQLNSSTQGKQPISISGIPFPRTFTLISFGRLSIISGRLVLILLRRTSKCCNVWIRCKSSGSALQKCVRVLFCFIIQASCQLLYTNCLFLTWCSFQKQRVLQGQVAPWQYEAVQRTYWMQWQEWRASEAHSSCMGAGSIGWNEAVVSWD